MAKDTHHEQERKNNDESLNTATRNKELWDSDEDDYLRHHIYDPVMENAVALGRTYWAIGKHERDLNLHRISVAIKPGVPNGAVLTLPAAIAERERLLVEGVPHVSIVISIWLQGRGQGYIVKEAPYGNRK